MIELSIKEKQRIGKLFKYYRKKNKVQWKEIEKIISKSTYSKIEKGYVSNKNEKYIKIFELYHTSFMYKVNFQEWLEDYLIQLNKILEEYKEEQFDSLFDELEKELGQHKHEIIYEQYYQVITYILNYYKYSKYMTLEEIEDCLELFKYIDFEEIMMVYLIETIYISNTNVHYSYEIENKLMSYITQINHPIVNHHLCMHYKTEGLFEKALIGLNQLMKYWKKKENDYRYIRTLMAVFVIYKSIDKNEANELISIFEDLKREKRIKNTLIPRLNYNIAMFYYNDLEYKKALPYFEENIYSFKREQDLLLVCAICTQLNLPIPNLINEINLSNHPHTVYLNFFRMKHSKVSKEKLVEYIFQDIIPNELNYQIYERPFWLIYEEELLKICDEDKRYAIKLVEYIKKKKEICKKG